MLKNLGNGYYQYNWKTLRTAGASGKMLLGIDIGDGVQHSAVSEDLRRSGGPPDLAGVPAGSSTVPQSLLICFHPRLRSGACQLPDLPTGRIVPVTGAARLAAGFLN